ncbi:MAG: hypothetical protein N3E45_09365 [Oscillatoriaceae bacterium SKW80]|nr:hypothetical protein [Oscillatoriaceae bacterium SKYG93]MCX8121023.1 hypothetical protein [Oscillatoriaceae bacterium SKW80]MDW8452296.1 hypothetical protein [Oscillatoriaceae cyanobacterium SKYGB_i_bin93]HIK26630.1 hypothetical protein [Oscillatoriaceae cyanobacterium M7585_C2015_266]
MYKPPSFPPKIPDNPRELERAICLLGNRTKNELGTKSRLELKNLIGIYPTAEEAASWKQTLKAISKGKKLDI